MTDIIKLARESELNKELWLTNKCMARLERFAELVSAPLKAENEALRKQMEAQKDEWLSWNAKRQSLEADAERYRCIRNPPYSDQWGDVYAMTFQRTGDMVLKGEDLDRVVDAAIDAARAKEQT